ncbi:MAG: hypothetical protein KDD06_21830 [Phaeodactylibacter sp.]|nr:hypothetical protein [Phaeodactylibacter sp.]
MNERQQIKIKLYEHCLEQVATRIQTARTALEAAQEAGNNETRSSAGDKYETGRAMMQMEQEKYKVQLLKAMELKNQLVQLRPGRPAEIVQAGALVLTDKGNFYLSAGLGKISLEREVFFAISLESPLGKQMRGKRKGERFAFRGKEYLIGAVI